MPLRRKNRQTEIYKLQDHEVLLTNRTRFLPADLVVAPGTVFLPATSRGRYRLVDVIAIANGGAAAGITSIILTGMVNNVKVNLLTLAAAGLTQSTMLRMGAANATVLADGASTNLTDPNTAISIERVGGALTGATSIDVMATYALESASMIDGR